MKIARAQAVISALVISFVHSFAVAADVDWPHYGGDLGSTKYSAIDQIDAGNASQLEIAWQWESVDNSTVAQNIADENFRASPAGWKATPIVVEGVMYVPTSFGRVVALDPASGEQKWMFDTRAWEFGRPANLGWNVRGVAYWEEGDDKRILFATNDSYLWSLNAETGQADTGFGDDGRIDLTEGLGREVNRAEYGVVSPPLVTNGIVVVNSIVSDGPRNKESPPGHVRAFNPKNGEQVWMFNTIPQAGELGNDTWENGSWEYSGNTNVWTHYECRRRVGFGLFTNRYANQ